MKHFILSAIFIFSLVSYSMADVELGINFGYGFPTNTFQDDWFLPYAEYEGIETDTSYEYSEYKDLYYSLGKGIKAGLDLTIYFNDNFGFYIGSGFSFLGVYNIENTLIYEGETETDNVSVKSMFLPINAGFKFKSDIGNFSPYVYVAPGLYIPVGVNAVWESKEGGITDKETYSIKFAPGLGVATGIGAKIKISDSFGFKFEFSPVFASARVKEVEIEDEGEKYKIIFKKNEADLPDDTNDIEYYHGGPKYSFSSFGANIGIVIGF